MYRTGYERQSDSREDHRWTKIGAAQELCQVVVHAMTTKSVRFGFRERLTNLLEVLLYKLLIKQGNFVAMDFATGICVRGLLLLKGRLQLLLGGADLNHHF